jgi:hypothetical protein
MRLSRSPSFQAGRGLNQKRRPLSQGGGKPSGGLFLAVRDRDKRLDAKFNSVARSLIRTEGVALSDFQGSHTADKPTANGRVDGLLDVLGLSRGLYVLLLTETIRSHSSLPPRGKGEVY